MKFSPYKLMQRVGVSGRLVAFFKTVCVYAAVSCGAGETGPSTAAAAAKCAPVVCLLVIVIAQRNDIPHDNDKPDAVERRRYCARIAAGLALSALGDWLLVWPQHFLPGMAAFALAHLAYISAFGWRPLAAAWVPPLLAGLGCYLWAVQAGGLLRYMVPVYSVLLTTMGWRGLARLSSSPHAAIGAALFLLSDAALGYSMFAEPLPYGKAIVMSTYYLAQLGIASSALQPPLQVYPTPSPAH